MLFNDTTVVLDRDVFMQRFNELKCVFADPEEYSTISASEGITSEEINTEALSSVESDYCSSFSGLMANFKLQLWQAEARKATEERLDSIVDQIYNHDCGDFKFADELDQELLVDLLRQFAATLINKRN